MSRTEARREYNRDYYEKTKERRSLLRKIRYAEKADEIKKKNVEFMRFRRTGCSPEKYNQLFEEQKGVCFLCEEIDENRSLAADHCHETGAVRKLLCGKCNRALGMFKDSPELLEKAANYVRSYR